MNERENRLRAWRRQGPQWLPISSGVPFIRWADFGYDEAEIEDVCQRHPILFPNYQKGTLEKNRIHGLATRGELRANEKYVDPWGCGWYTTCDGMVGTVREHPLADLDDVEHFRAPNPDLTDGMNPIDWESLKQASVHPDRENFFFGVGLPHGHTFLRVQDLRGYENFLFDMVDEDERIEKVLDVVTSFHEELIQRFIALHPDVITIPEDLGMQTGPMISPDLFKQYISPCYDRLIRPIKQAGILVHEHSDGYIMDLTDELIRLGSDVINMQDLVNGIDNIQKHLKGRVSIDLDIDRQNISVHGSPNDCREHVRECVEKLGSKEGGLSLTYQPWPVTPVANMDAIFGAMEEFGVINYPFK